MFDSKKYNLNVKKWFKDNGDYTHRLNYNLNSNSIVFDAGGYKGIWSENIYSKYKCKIFIFEPIKKYFDILNEKFNNNNDIKIFNFGLSDKSENIKIYHSHDASSIYKDFINYYDTEEIVLINFSEFFVNNDIKIIDLFKINIEGSEYNLLEKIIDNNHHLKIKNIQIQFHYFIPDAELKRNNIREKLRKSHNLTYDYEFVWENWELK